MDFITLTIKALKILSDLVGGNFGLGIVILTIIVRCLMWSLSFSQQKSMRKMQKLQPELKRIQDKYKHNPQLMQQKMMEFYKENNSNPMGGCLPILLQMPIFILLYSALISPQFISIAGDSQFLFIKRLDATLQGHTGVSNNGNFQVGRRDVFAVNKDRITVTLLNNKELENVKIKSKKALEVQGEIEPGTPMDMFIDLNYVDLKFSEIEQIASAKVTVVDKTTRETEDMVFKRDGSALKASIPTIAVEKTGYNYDVFLLIVLFALTMFISQKIMMATQNQKNMDPQTEAMQKMMGFTMPIMITATFIFIPIPAGVLLYLVVSNIFQVFQTVIINKQLDNMEEEEKTSATSDANLSDAKKVDAKSVKTIENKEEK